MAFWLLLAANGLIIEKCIWGFCCRPRCQKSTHEFPWPSRETAIFRVKKPSVRELLQFGASGGNTPDCHRSRILPTAALYSSVSRSLVSLPPSSFQLLGALKSCAWPPSPYSVSLVPTLPSPQRP